MTDLTELRQLLEEGTPGPWSTERMDRDEEAVHTIEAKDALVVEQLGCACCDYGLAVKYADADLIVAAVNALPELLDAAEALTTEPTEAEVEAAARATERVPMHMSNEDRCRAALRAARGLQ